MATAINGSTWRVSRCLLSLEGYIRIGRGQTRPHSTPADPSIPNSKQRFVPSSGTYPKGFSVSGTNVGVKPTNTRFPDLALIQSETPCSGAAVFTTNKFQAAPVQVSKEVLQKREGRDVRSIVVNAGCANAVTGTGGLNDAWSMASTVDRCSGGSAENADGSSTLVMSTGVIGQRYGSTPSKDPRMDKLNANVLVDSQSRKSWTEYHKGIPLLNPLITPG